MNFFKALLWAGCVALTSASCTKDDNPTDVCVSPTTAASSAEVDTLRNFLTAKGITATQDARGFFYQINRPGDTAKRPNNCSSIKITYTGRFTNGVQFDARANVEFVLRGLILGWQEGLPLIGKGGSIVLYLPPSLGYGATGSGGSGGIPGYTYLIFTIDLVDIT